MAPTLNQFCQAPRKLRPLWRPILRHFSLQILLLLIFANYIFTIWKSETEKISPGLILVSLLPIAALLFRYAEVRWEKKLLQNGTVAQGRTTADSISTRRGGVILSYKFSDGRKEIEGRGLRLQLEKVLAGSEVVIFFDSKRPQVNAVIR